MMFSPRQFLAMLAAIPDASARPARYQATDRFGEVGAFDQTIPAPTCVDRFGLALYQAGPDLSVVYPVPDHLRAGLFTVGDVDLVLVVACKDAFGEYANPSLPPGFDGQSSVDAFGDDFYAGENYPPDATSTDLFATSLCLWTSRDLFGGDSYGVHDVFSFGQYFDGPVGPVGAGSALHPDYPLALETARPWTVSDTRIDSLIMEEAVLE